MKTIFASLILFSVSALVGQGHAEDMHGHSHEGHLHETFSDGTGLEVNPERFDTFIEGLVDVQIVVVSVKGMVCDFCARGIEKTFRRDKSVKKIDVDLDYGKVLIAYSASKEIDFDDIKKKVLANGQSATDLKIIKV